MNYEYIERMHNSIQYFKALGAWATAEMLQGWLNAAIAEMKKESK